MTTMTARQFKAYRKKLFFHPTEAAEALGISYGALNHWETGRRAVPLWAVKFLACIEALTATTKACERALAKIGLVGGFDLSEAILREAIDKSREVTQRPVTVQ